MTSITYWNRLIPQPLDTSLERGLAAEVRDPAWTLARQLQFGEFLGADGGSPAFVDIGTRTAAFNRANTPLEPIAESEAVNPDVTVRVELGQLLNSLIDQMASPATLAATAKADLLAKYPLPALTEPAVVNLLAACTGTVPDGVAVYADVAKNQFPEFDATTNTALKPVFAAFSEWVVDVLGDIGTAPPANWSAASLGYSISFTATLPDGRSATLSAQPDRSNDLEWYSFEVAQAAAGASAAPLVTQSVIPTHVRFRGMPNDRFWDFESNKIEFGNVVADVSDAGRLLFLDFMLIHGVGWFIAPLDVPVGSLCQVRLDNCAGCFWRHYFDSASRRDTGACRCPVLIVLHHRSNHWRSGQLPVCGAHLRGGGAALGAGGRGAPVPRRRGRPRMGSGGRSSRCDG